MNTIKLVSGVAPNYPLLFSYELFLYIYKGILKIPLVGLVCFQNYLASIIKKL